jgi:predicted anti-sigma-YlaC factor YlaD
MSMLPLSCAEARAALADRLDDLLEPAQAERVDAHVAACADCAAGLAARAHAKSALEGAWSVEAPAGDLAERALERFAASRALSPGRRRLALAASHLAALAAGVLLAFTLIPQGAPGAVLPPTSPPSAPQVPAARSNEPEPASPPAPPYLFAPRRIR